MANKSKNIGKAFEREVANAMTLFFGLPFQRIPNSGAFIGGANAFRISTMSKSQVLLARGDIIVPDELSHMMIECKKRAGIAYNQLFQEEGCKEINVWIDQVLIDYKACPDVTLFLLIFKSNRQGKFACFLKDFKLIYHQNHINYFYKGKSFIITEFNTKFLELNKDLMLNKEYKPEINKEEII